MNIKEARKAQAIASIRDAAHDITTEDIERGRMVKLETGLLTGTIAGGKVHNLRYQIRTWDDGTDDLYVRPLCGTIRNTRQGGHYVNYYSNLGREITCTKCLSR
jgi:hypothetical protein